MNRREKLEEWFPVALRYGGFLVAFPFIPLVWLLTDRVEPALIGLALTMMGLGEGQQALRDFFETRKPPQGDNLKVKE
jgi:hypothetical protein